MDSTEAKNSGSAGPHRDIRLLVADDHSLILEMIEMFISNVPDMSVETASSVEGALEKIAAHGAFDLVLLDLDMPGMNGIEGLARTIAANNGRPVGIFTGNPTARVVEDVMSSGAAGLIPKTTSLKSLANAARFMVAGEKYVPMDLIREHNTVQSGVTAPLTEREMAVLFHLSQGMPNREIGEELHLAEPTIKMHVKSICKKLSVNNRTQAVITARKLKLV